MDKLVAYKIIDSNKEFLFPNSQYTDEQLAQILLDADNSAQEQLSHVTFQVPSKILFASILFGQYGIDRFMLGDFKLGALKLLTMGGFFVWTIMDIFTAQKRCRDYNCRSLLSALHCPF